MLRFVRLPQRTQILAGILGAVLAGGCSEFVDRPDGVSDATGGDDVDVPLTDTAVDADVVSVDATDDDGAISADDGSSGVDPGSDSDPGADLPADGEPSDADTSDAPSCSDVCTLGANSCVDVQNIATCITSPATGCTVWDDPAACPTPNLCQGSIACTATSGDASCEENTAEAVTCSPGTPCIFEVCNPDTGQCDQSSLEIGAVCEDDDPCTPISICDNQLNCKGTPDASLCPCSSSGDCDAFDDGDKCNGAYLCSTDGACEKQAPVAGTCPPNADPCLNNKCESTTGACLPVPGPDGIICPNASGDMCVLSSQCIGGDCMPNVVDDCAGTPLALCEEASCVPNTGACEVTPLSDCCGNGTQAGAEQCDDSNDTPDDGCSPTCMLPTCDSQSLTLSGAGCAMLSDAALVSDILQFTIDLWVRLGSASVGVTTIAAMRPPAGPQGWALEVDGSGNLQMTLTDTAGSPFVASGPPLVVGAWTHVRVARSGDDTGFWVDGVATPAVTAATPLSGATGSAVLSVGCTEDQEQYLHADIDDLWIRSTVASTPGTDIAPPSAPPAPDANTLALYHFDETSPGLSPSSSSAPALVWRGSAATAPDDPFGAALTDGVCPVFCPDRALSLTATESLLASSADAAPLGGADALTVEFWYRNTTLDPGALMAYRSGGATPEGWSIQQFEDGGDVKLAWLEEFNGMSSQWNSPTLPQDGGWHHVAITRSFNDTTNQATVRYFVDGNDAPSTSQAAASFPMGGQFHIGTLNGSLLPATYDLDDLRVTTEVVYAVGDFTVPAGNAAHRANTVFMFGFNEGSGAVAYNAIPTTMGPAVNGGDLIWLNPGGVPTPCP